MTSICTLIFEFHTNELNNVYVNSNIGLNKLYRVLFVQYNPGLPDKSTQQRTNVPSIGIIAWEYLNKLFFVTILFNNIPNTIPISSKV